MHTSYPDMANHPLRRCVAASLRKVGRLKWWEASHLSWHDNLLRLQLVEVLVETSANVDPVSSPFPLARGSKSLSHGPKLHAAPPTHTTR